MDNLKKFLIEGKGFLEKRIDNGLKRIASNDNIKDSKTKGISKKKNK